MATKKRQHKPRIAESAQVESKKIADESQEESAMSANTGALDNTAAEQQGQAQEQASTNSARPGPDIHIPTGVSDSLELNDGRGGRVRQFEESDGFDWDEFASPKLVTVQSEEAEVFRLRKKEDDIDFSREVLAIEIHPSSEKNPAPTFAIYVNGEEFVFRYGGKYRVPRYAVEGLLRARPENYQNVEYLDKQGDRAVKHPSTRSLRYPFFTHYDPSKSKGLAWQKSIMSQP